MAELDFEGFWEETLIQLRKDLGGEEFSGWFSEIKYVRAEENIIVISVPSAFHRDTIKSRYMNSIISKLKALSGKEISMEMDITKTIEQKSEKKEKTKAVGVSVQPEKKETKIEIIQKLNQKRTQNSQMLDYYTFERYVIGENNKFAANAALAIKDNPGRVYNPFLIYGGVGLGKTHLMQAIGNYIHENSENEVIYVTSENFLNEYIEGVRPQEHGQNTMKSFKNKYRHTDVLLIDDIQFFTDKPGVQEELFHTFNSLLNAKKQLVFTCDRPLAELKKFPERLISRFGLGLTVDLQPPRYEERCAILRSTAESQNVDIPSEVIELISNNIESNIRDLIAALNTLIAFGHIMKKPITLELAQSRLSSFINAPKHSNLSMDIIIRVVAEYFGLTPNDLKGKKRTQNVVSARQLAMFIGRRITEYSTTEIGQDFGGRDHTTVMHSIKKIEDKLLTDTTLESTIDNLKRSIKEFSAKH